MTRRHFEAVFDRTFDAHSVGLQRTVGKINPTCERVFVEHLLSQEALASGHLANFSRAMINHSSVIERAFVRHLT